MYTDSDQTLRFLRLLEADLVFTEQFLILKIGEDLFLPFSFVLSSCFEHEFPKIRIKDLDLLQLGFPSPRFEVNIFQLLFCLVLDPAVAWFSLWIPVCKGIILLL